MRFCTIVLLIFLSATQPLAQEFDQLEPVEITLVGRYPTCDKVTDLQRLVSLKQQLGVTYDAALTFFLDNREFREGFCGTFRGKIELVAVSRNADGVWTVFGDTIFGFMAVLTRAVYVSEAKAIPSWPDVFQVYQ